MTAFPIGGRLVGERQPCFVIAEAGVNHNGDPALAHQLVEQAALAGADAIKFQTFSADRLVTRSAPKADYQRDTTDASESQYEMLCRLELSSTLHEELSDHSRRLNVLFLSTPFDEASADLLERLDVPAFKVPSGEITNLPLLGHLASKRRPIIMSTGMATLSEVRVAVDALRAAGATELALLHCVSQYPADPSDANLRAMQTMRDDFALPVGYSDHTRGIEVALAAVALGACIIEKHFTLNRSLPGPDHQASIEPDQLTAMVKGIRIVEAALGHGRKEPSPAEHAIAAVVRKSLVAACSIPAGTVLTRELVAVMRPGTGMPPDMLPLVLGRRVTTDLAAGTPLSQDVLA